MLENIEVLYHSSIKIDKEKIIYIDPFKIDKNYNDADIVFITHDHYDHYSEEDLDKVIKENTTIVIPEELLTKVLRKGINQNAIVTVSQIKNIWYRKSNLKQYQRIILIKLFIQKRMIG